MEDVENVEDLAEGDEEEEDVESSGESEEEEDDAPVLPLPLLEGQDGHHVELHPQSEITGSQAYLNIRGHLNPLYTMHPQKQQNHTLYRSFCTQT